MEINQVQKQPDDKGKTFYKVVWMAIPMLAMLIIGIVLGVKIQGDNIAEALSTGNYTPCVDDEGNVLLRSYTNKSIFDNVEITDYSTR